MQVYDLDVKLVDARRPKVAKPTAAHKEERLIPYKPDVRSRHATWRPMLPPLCALGRSRGYEHGSVVFE